MESTADATFQQMMEVVKLSWLSGQKYNKRAENAPQTTRLYQ